MKRDLIDVSDNFLKAFMGAAVRRAKGVGTDSRVFKTIYVKEVSLMGVLPGEMSIYVVHTDENSTRRESKKEYYLCRPPSSLTRAVEVWERSLEILKRLEGKEVRIAYIPENFIVCVYEI
jgi:hypothetical protein